MHSRVNPSARTWPRIGIVGLLAGTRATLQDYRSPLRTPGTLNQLIWCYCPVRYGLSFLSVATLAVILVLHDLATVLQSAQYDMPDGRRFKLIYRIITGSIVPVVLTLIGMFQLFRTDARWVDEREMCLLIAGNIVCVTLAVVMIFAKWSSCRTLLLVGILVAIVPASSFTCFYLAGQWHESYASHYDEQFGGEAHTLLEKYNPETGKICVLDDRYYQFFGSRRQFRVVQPHHIGASDDVLALLQSNEINVVVTAPLLYTKRFSGFDQCVRSNPNMFHPMAHGQNFLVLQINPPNRPASLKK